MNTPKLALMALVLMAFAMPVFSQGRFSISVHAGPNGNFFVRSYDEGGGPSGLRFYKKNFIGFAFETEGKFLINKRSWLTGGYLYSNNTRVVNFNATQNGIDINTNDWTIRHRENKFYVGYERQILERVRGLNMVGGIFYSTYKQQEIELAGNYALYWERTWKNARLNDAGVYAGLHYERNIDTHFKLGIQSRLYFNVTSVIFEQMTLTPTLTYTFSKKK
jgi:hypothetical protein